jgi:hypothetical protein
MTTGWQPSRALRVPERSDKPLSDSLWVLHWPRQADLGGLPAAVTAQLAGAGLLVDTCMRQVLIGTSARPHVAAAHTAGMEMHAGVSAYRLLLEIVTGLRSAVCGETNVHGQFRRAWQASLSQLPAGITQPLSAVIAALFSDAQAIRQTHLQGVGGNSYGSLARRLLTPARGARVLFVGTGALARSMLPFFATAELGAWNHRPVTPPAGIHRWFGPAEADAAADWAEHLIFTTPADAEHDAGWQARLRQTAVRSLLHLGHRRGQGSGALHWNGVAAAFDLDHILDAAAARANVASLQLVRARTACAEQAAARYATDSGLPALASPRRASARA